MKSAGSELAIVEPKPRAKPNDRDWSGLRAEYEQSGRKCSLRYLARRENIPQQTIFDRSRREGWHKHETTVKLAARNLALKAAATIAEDKLAPWIEKEKAKLTRAGLLTGKRGIVRISRFQRANKVIDARDEANIAKAFESYHRAARSALGMGEGTVPGGVLHFQMLANKAAIQINNGDDQ